MSLTDEDERQKPCSEERHGVVEVLPYADEHLLSAVRSHNSFKRVVENLGALPCFCNDKKEERVRSNFALSQALIVTFAS